MNETHSRGGPNLGLLLLIPAAVIITKAAMHRRAMMDMGWSGPGSAGRRYGQHRFAGADGEPGARSFQIPPWIESALAAWHTRAHEAPESAAASDPGRTPV